MKITIITVSYNSDRTINDTIKSVLKQSYADIEYIIIDGNSQDKTLDIIKSYQADFNGRLKYISEPDKGIYDAMNKGINLSSGDLIGILNCDDMYLNKNSIKEVVTQIIKTNTDSIYTDLIIVDQFNSSKIIRTCTYSKFKLGMFSNGWHPPHPTFFVKKEIYNKYGVFDLAFKISSDFDFMMRILEVNCISTTYLPLKTIQMRNGGLSTSSLKNIFLSQKECLESFKKNNIEIKFFSYFLNKYFHKLLQYNIQGLLIDLFSKIFKKKYKS